MSPQNLQSLTSELSNTPVPTSNSSVPHGARQSSAARPQALESDTAIRIDGVSRWYGEVLGVNKVSVDIQSGITGLVGPNGSGKTTLLNLIAGLLRPGQGRIKVLGQNPWNNAPLRRRVGFCTQTDQFYENFSGRRFMELLLALHGRGDQWARARVQNALEYVNLAEAQNRQIRTYSKGMRQRLKIALALAHEPDVLLLDEPFNGLDPVGRHEMMTLFSAYAKQGRTVLISSHILHEIEQMTTRLLMMSNGYVMAEGEIHHVRDLLRKHPFKVFVRCDQPRRLAAILLCEENVISASVEDDNSLLFMTRDPDRFYLRLNELVREHQFDIGLVTLADENMQSIYRYLSGREHH